MSHLTFLQKNKSILEFRSHIIRLIREWFWAQGFLEVETPLIVWLPGQEPYLSPMKIQVHDDRGQVYPGYLHTSPEYTMKKMLAAGFTNIFSLGKVFRDYESFGGTHNPEFTMIEWYRIHKDFWKIMGDVEGLICHVVEKLRNEEMKKLGNIPLNFQRLHMRDVWKKCAGVNLDDYLTREKMYELCVGRGYDPGVDEPYEDMFFRIFLNEIESTFSNDTITVIHHYPLHMAALSKASETERGYAERFEVYWGRMELANAFTELTDADEQLRRLKEEQVYRKKIGKDVYDIDLEFIESLRTMPPAAGIALGVDRLVQALLRVENIDDVLPLPMSQLFRP